MRIAPEISDGNYCFHLQECLDPPLLRKGHSIGTPQAFHPTPGLAVLALLTIALSLAALLQSRPRAIAGTDPETSRMPTGSVSRTASPLMPSQSPSATEPPQTSVVVIGDGTSLSKDSLGWLGRSTQALNWRVTNVSVAGMGFVKKPSQCPSSRCTTFVGVTPAAAAVRPHLVIVFGGMADGDTPIGPAAHAFFTKLRKKLPRAEIVALAPVMTRSKQAGWIRLHRINIDSAVSDVGGRLIELAEPVGGRLIELAEPEFRSGKLTAKGQRQVAKKVIAALS